MTLNLIWFDSLGCREKISIPSYQKFCFIPFLDAEEHQSPGGISDEEEEEEEEMLISEEEIPFKDDPEMRPTNPT